jgi:DHA1 family tetracycline resistance protein-like MFS transporter
MQLNIKDIVPEPKVATDWRLSKISNKLRPKSLSDLLKDIPEFQRELLPNSRQAITQINRALRKNQFIAPSEETKKGNLYSSVALAIDRGALMLRDEIDNNRLITTLKIHNKYGNKKYKDHRNAIVIIINKFESIAQNEPFSKETAGYLFLLGKLEPIIRGFRPFSDVIEHGLPSNLSTDSIRNWLSDIISADLSSEIIDLLNVISKLQLNGHFFANPIFGQLSDKYGRRVLLALAIIGTGLSNFVFAFGAVVASLWMLMSARLFNGITGGSLAIAEAAAADISTDKDRAKNFGLIGASLGLAFMFGPALGGVLSDPTILPFFGAPFVFIVSGILSIVNAGFILKYLPETSPMDRSIAIRPARAVRNIGRAFLNTDTRGIYSLSFIYSFGFTLFTSFLGVYLVDQLEYTQREIGFFFFYVGVLIIPFQVLLVPYVDRAYKQITMLYVGFGVLAATLALIALSTNTWQLLLITVFFSAANAISRTTVTSVVSQKADQKSQGAALGVNASVQALGQALPALFAGIIAASLGVTAPLFFGTAVFTFGVVLVFVNRKRLQ